MDIAHVDHPWKKKSEGGRDPGVGTGIIKSIVLLACI